jgi:hypothetical protein
VERAAGPTPGCNDLFPGKKIINHNMCKHQPPQKTVHEHMKCRQEKRTPSPSIIKKTCFLRSHYTNASVHLESHGPGQHNPTRDFLSAGGPGEQVVLKNVLHGNVYTHIYIYIDIYFSLKRDTLNIGYDGR